MALMLTNRSAQVLEYFSQLKMEDYARADNCVNDLVIDQAPLDGFYHTMRLTTTLKPGVIH